MIMALFCILSLGGMGEGVGMEGVGGWGGFGLGD